MELKSYDDVLKLHQQFADQVSKQMLALRKPSKATGEAIIAGTRASLKEAQDAVASLEKSKAETLQRLDRRSPSRRTIERLTRELGDLEKTRTPPPDAGTPKTAKVPGKKKKSTPQ